MRGRISSSEIIPPNTCFVFSRICLRAISRSSRCRSTSNGLTMDSDGFVRFHSVNTSSGYRDRQSGSGRDQTRRISKGGCEFCFSLLS